MRSFADISRVRSPFRVTGASSSRAMGKTSVAAGELVIQFPIPGRWIRPSGDFIKPFSRICRSEKVGRGPPRARRKGASAVSPALPEPRAPGRARSSRDDAGHLHRRRGGDPFRAPRARAGARGAGGRPRRRRGRRALRRRREPRPRAALAPTRLPGLRRPFRAPRREPPRARAAARRHRGGEPQAARPERRAAARERGARPALAHRRPHAPPQPSPLPGPVRAGGEARRPHPPAARPRPHRHRRLQAPERRARARGRRRRAPGASRV